MGPEPTARQLPLYWRLLRDAAERHLMLLITSAAGILTLALLVTTSGALGRRAGRQDHAGGSADFRLTRRRPLLVCGRESCSSRSSKEASEIVRNGDQRCGLRQPTRTGDREA